MPLRVTIRWKDTETVRDFAVDRLAVGRVPEPDEIGLDLSSDPSVSRHHARFEVKTGAVWVLDLGSTWGTKVNGREIPPGHPWRLGPEDAVCMGRTILRVELLPGPCESPPDASCGAGAGGHDAQITAVLETGGPLCLGDHETATAIEKRLGLLLDLPAQFGAQEDLDALLQLVMDRVVSVIPHARRGAFLLRDAKSDALLLKAYVSADQPAVSETLARRALAERRGFLWHATGAAGASRSVREHHILHGMYAPLEWRGEIFGVVCVDSPLPSDSFVEADLKFLMAIGHYAAMALSEIGRRTELERSQRLVDRLLANFSSKVRLTLIEQARQGKLRPGGIKSEVTILLCDLVGFSRKAASLDAHDVVDLLNDYLQPVVDIVLRHEGTLDKFIGDAALAVFGSPEPHPRQHQEALRAAVEIQEAVQATSQLRAARGDVTCAIRVGLHCGEVFHGFIGTLNRLEFTVIGDPVNRTARYCDGAGPGEIILSADLYQRVYADAQADRVVVASPEGDLPGYRLKALRTDRGDSDAHESATVAGATADGGG